ncbi:helix-turn-helix domain-containing protein [Dyadobacter aurulentus]|uniref:helix-turn-helix domain-containing protein n=1 Tax=Dyadobacter sp. UC 10 TaxID=2605428 RepID=UPI001CEDD1C3
MREWSVLLLIGDGLTTSEIAEHLFVEPKSIANYKGRIRMKLKLTGQNSLFVFSFSNKEHLNKIHQMLQP